MSSQSLETLERRMDGDAFDWDTGLGITVLLLVRREVGVFLFI